MKKMFFKFAPFALAAMAIVSWSLTVLADGILWIWVPLGVIHVLLGFYFGVLLRRLNFGNYRDYLTGVYNRRYFYLELNREIQRLKRSRAALSIISIDIDHFKMVNDTYGHGVGDKVLVWLAGIIKLNCREIDCAARLGGEEFTVILPETDSEGAKKFADRLRQAVESESICNGIVQHKITISIGIVTTKTDTDVDKLVAMADDAMYVAKRTRNCVAVSKTIERALIAN